MPKTLKFSPAHQVGPVNLPTYSAEQRYAQAQDVKFIGASTVHGYPVNVMPIGDMDLASFVLHSISPVQVVPRLADDVQAFSRAVKDIVAAVNDKVITPEEGDAVIGYLAEQFAARRASQALARIGMPAVLT